VVAKVSGRAAKLAVDVVPHLQVAASLVVTVIPA
jgi:hypothetical protein